MGIIEKCYHSIMAKIEKSNMKRNIGINVNNIIANNDTLFQETKIFYSNLISYNINYDNCNFFIKSLKDKYENKNNYKKEFKLWPFYKFFIVLLLEITKNENKNKFNLSFKSFLLSFYDIEGIKEIFISHTSEKYFEIDDFTKIKNYKKKISNIINPKSLSITEFTNDNLSEKPNKDFFFQFKHNNSYLFLIYSLVKKSKSININFENVSTDKSGEIEHIINTFFNLYLDFVYKDNINNINILFSEINSLLNQKNIFENKERINKYLSITNQNSSLELTKDILNFIKNIYFLKNYESYQKENLGEIYSKDKIICFVFFQEENYYYFIKNNSVKIISKNCTSNEQDRIIDFINYYDENSNIITSYDFNEQGYFFEILDKIIFFTASKEQHFNIDKKEIFNYNIFVANKKIALIKIFQNNYFEFQFKIEYLEENYVDLAYKSETILLYDIYNGIDIKLYNDFNLLFINIHSFSNSFYVYNFLENKAILYPCFFNIKEIILSSRGDCAFVHNKDDDHSEWKIDILIINDTSIAKFLNNKLFIKKTNINFELNLTSHPTFHSNLKDLKLLYFCSISNILFIQLKQKVHFLNLDTNKILNTINIYDTEIRHFSFDYDQNTITILLSDNNILKYKLNPNFLKKEIIFKLPIYDTYENYYKLSRVMTIPQSGNLNSPPPSGRYPEVIFSAN